jgi:DNA repair protein RecO (recombination protein O)
MPILKDRAVVLRVREQSNSSQILTLLGRRHGQMRIMAKGSRRWTKKGFEGGFDTLVWGEIVVYPRPQDALWIFKEWTEDRRLSITAVQAREALAAVSFVAELAEALTRETSGQDAYESPNGNSRPMGGLHAGLFDALRALADKAESSRPNWSAWSLHGALRLLEAEGLSPDWRACGNCGQPPRAKGETCWLLPEGLLCADCLSAHPAEQDDPRRPRLAIRPDTLAALDYYQRHASPVKISAGGALGLADAVQALIHNALDGSLRSLPAARHAIAALGTAARPHVAANS